MVFKLIFYCATVQAKNVLGSNPAVQFKLHVIQAHRLPLTFFELLVLTLVVLTKLMTGFLL